MESRFGPKWIKVFSHDKSGGLFCNKTDALSKNQDDPGALLFSLLDTLEDMRLDDNSFHLKICFPEIDKCNDWVQTSNLATETTITGFKAIKLDHDFKGLGLNSACGPPTAIDYRPTSGGWWYAIGSMRDYGGSIPGPGVSVKKVELFAEIPVRGNKRIEHKYVYQNAI